MNNWYAYGASVMCTCDILESRWIYILSYSQIVHKKFIFNLKKFLILQCHRSQGK